MSRLDHSLLEVLICPHLSLDYFVFRACGFHDPSHELQPPVCFSPYLQPAPHVDELPVQPVLPFVFPDQARIVVFAQRALHFDVPSQAVSDGDVPLAFLCSCFHLPHSHEEYRRLSRILHCRLLWRLAFHVSGTPSSCLGQQYQVLNALVGSDVVVAHPLAFQLLLVRHPHLLACPATPSIALRFCASCRAPRWRRLELDA